MKDVIPTDDPQGTQPALRLANGPTTHPQGRGECPGAGPQQVLTPVTGVPVTHH